jgi:hypothetical protein
MHPHLTGYMGQNFVPIFKFHLKHRIRQRLQNGAFDFDRFLFRHVRPRYPFVQDRCVVDRLIRCLLWVCLPICLATSTAADTRTGLFQKTLVMTGQHV